VCVSTVHRDFITAAGRVGYKLTLSCGCRFWELRDENAACPNTGTTAICFAEESAGAAYHGREDDVSSANLLALPTESNDPAGHESEFGKPH
jgi:hypothetical protein